MSTTSNLAIESAAPAALLLDDDPFVSGVVTRQLATLGIDRVTATSDGAAALRTLRAHGAFDLVICDLKMPGMDGVEFLRHLATVQRSATVILMSAQEPKVVQLAGELVRSHGLRLLGTISKPVRLEDLSALVRKLHEPLPEPAAAQTVTPEDLRVGIAAGEIEVYVQPKIGAYDRQLTGVEALARWVRPDGSVLLPDAFIPVAEAHGLIDALTDQVLERALSSCSEWRRQGIHTRIAVNFATSTLVRIDLPERLTEMAASHDLDVRQIVLEVTESGVVRDAAHTLDVLARLRLRGFELSIDDFGTGYSSLKQLLSLPFGELKIDQSFVADMLHSRAAARIVESTLALARDLSLRVTAEGVESESQMGQLALLGCHELQGYGIAPPFPRAELPAWARRNGVLP